ncbi:MAG: DEAD/DEAH box helicase [Acidobacteria bacterium]|nr:MAG: DEAD/DEAH box helicase [Acidobacteriota bacterium]
MSDQPFRTEFDVGDIVAGLEPSEYVEIRQITSFGPRILVEGIGVTSRREIQRPLTQEQLQQLRKVRGADYTFDGDAGAFLLGVEAERIRIAHQFDPLFAVNSSVVDILPHQVEAVYRYLLPLPRIRFLLADDTGAGKTIMAGLLIKELLFRAVISKVLIITPGGLTRQWQDEMREKFGLIFRLINRISFEAEPGQFAHDEGFFITSVDFIARHEGCLNAAKETSWDMIVVDEAHKLSAYEYGTKVERSDRYRAVEALASQTDHLLFLTATPHRGRKDTFRRLLMLLDADLFQKDELVTRRIREAVTNYATETFESEAAISRARNRFFLRRLKEEMIDWDGQQLFKPRHTRTVGYELTPEELKLYQAVTRYVRSRRKEAKARRNRYVELTLMVMQRRLASSIAAITHTLQNRLAALDEVLHILRDFSQPVAEKRRLLRGNTDDIPTNIAEYEDLDESQRDDVDRRIFRQVLSDDPDEVQREREEVANLLHIAESLKHHQEAKFSELLHVLDSSDVIRREDEKLVIFTEHKDTLESLANRLRHKGYQVATIHGGMDADTRQQAQREFHRRCKILVATDAAGEGINLQFCRYLINWDIPWNPNRLEQRMGRIHRYGQKDDVWVYNLVAVNTREGAVLEKVLKKLDVMREQMGTDRVYDVIDELLEDVPLIELIECSLDSDDHRPVVDQVEQRADDSLLRRRAAELIAVQKKQSLASRLDLRSARELRDTSDERRLQPCFIERFFKRAYRAAGGTVTEDRYFPVFHVGHTPNEILDIARQRNLAVADKYETPFVFDKQLLSVASQIRVPEHTKLLGPGHPLFDALIEWAIRRARDAFTRGAILIDPNIAQPQQIWLVRSSIEDGQREEKKRLAHQQLSVVIADHLGLRATSPANLLNYTVPEGSIERPDVPEHSIKDVQM